jgi:hypothetical protein
MNEQLKEKVAAPDTRYVLMEKIDVGTWQEIAGTSTFGDAVHSARLYIHEEGSDEVTIYDGPNPAAIVTGAFLFIESSRTEQAIFGVVK